MSDPYSGIFIRQGLSIFKITPRICLLIGLLPNIIFASLAGLRFSPLTSIKNRQFDLSSTGFQSNNIDELDDYNQAAPTSSSLSSSISSQPSSSSYSTNSASYGLPNAKAYSQSTSSLNVLPGSSMIQSYPNSGNYPLPNYGSSSIGYPRTSSLNHFNYYGQQMRRSNTLNYPNRASSLSSYGGYPPSSRYGSYPPFISRFRGYYPYHRNGLRRNGYRSRYNKGRYSKRYRKPYYYGARNYRSWYPSYRSKYNSDYEYDSRETDSHMGSESSPSETFYSLTSNNNSGSKDYLKIGGIGNNIISYLANSILRGDPSKMLYNNSTANSSLDTSKESLYDGPFIQFGETKITLKSNDKGGITVTVGRSKM